MDQDWFIVDRFKLFAEPILWSKRVPTISKYIGVTALRIEIL